MQQLEQKKEEKAAPVDEPTQAHEAESKKKPQKKQTVGQTVTSAEAQPGVAVPCDIGIIVNVTQTTTGRKVLIADVDDQGAADLSKPFLQVDEQALPRALVQQAWRMKHLIQAPKAVRRAAVRGQTKQSEGL